MRPKCPPGPVATSCLTCRRRRKKCDRARPACERCAQDKQDCLGYDHIQERASTTGSIWDSKHSAAIREIVFPAYPSSLEGSQPEESRIGSSSARRLDEVTEHPLSLSDASARIHASSVFNSNTFSDGCDVGPGTSVALARVVPLHTPSSKPPLSTDNQLLSTDGSPAAYVPWSNTRQESDIILAPSEIYPGFPLSIDVSTPKTPPMFPPSSDKLIGFILSQYERIFSVMYLTPKRQHAIRMRDHLVHRLQGSSIARCALFIGAKMFESRLDSATFDRRDDFHKSIKHFEQKLLLVPVTSSLYDLQDYLNGSLEVAFLKMQLSFTRQLLSSASTTFLQIVYSESTLWSSSHAPVSISLDRIFSSSRYELGRFAMLDITCAMAYGIPQLVDYDTTASAIRPSDHPIEWVQGCPSEFLFCIAEINRRYSNGYMAHDWHLVEQRLLSFEAHPSDAQDVEPWIAIARLAIIESWRQTLLIYLYMAVCGVPSDDHRVQSAVHQLFQLFKTVRKQQPPKANMRLVFQCLLAGACTSSEKQRAYVRERLLDFYDNKLWLLPGSQFVPVLDHLWHGVAANGKPIKWSDYVLSRQKALPL